MMKKEGRSSEQRALDKLYNEVDADDIRPGIDAISELATLEDDLEILRAKILAVEGMSSPVGYGDDRSIWDLADELGLAIGRNVETLGRLDGLLDKITMMDPKLEELAEEI